GGRFDPEHDRGESPEPPGARVFSREIRTAPFPPRFRQPNTLVKYSGETDPAVWLNDYRLACQLGSATEDAVIIRNLPLHLADATRTGSSTCLRIRYTTGPTWSICLWATFRARTC